MRTCEATKSCLRYDVHGSSCLSVASCLWRRSGVSGRPMQVGRCTLFNTHLIYGVVTPDLFVSMQSGPLQAMAVSFHH